MTFNGRKRMVKYENFIPYNSKFYIDFKKILFASKLNGFRQIFRIMCSLPVFKNTTKIILYDLINHPTVQIMSNRYRSSISLNCSANMSSDSYVCINESENKTISRENYAAHSK